MISSKLEGLVRAYPVTMPAKTFSGGKRSLRLAYANQERAHSSSMLLCKATMGQSTALVVASQTVKYADSEVIAMHAVVL